MKHAGSWSVLAAVLLSMPPRVVHPGLDVLLTDSLHLVRDRSVGLVTNAAGIDRAGVPAVDRLRAAGVRLVALFSPEHGFRGAAAPGEHVASAVDSATGLPIYSLYGATRAPTDAMLRGIDVLLVDLPDVGARYYTYLSTTLEVMKVAARRRVPVVILDRPNPIGGHAVQGNVLEPAHRSFIGALAMPMRHGMTLGELARLGNAELAIGAHLTVVPASGWRRRDGLAVTGLPFVAPSPNLRDPESLYHYPGVCLFEGTALSVGRGTEYPFHQVGAPWLDVAAVLERVGRTPTPGVRLDPVSFTAHAPADGKFGGRTVPGIRFVLTDPATYDAPRTALVVLTAIQAIHPDQIGWIPEHFDRLAGGPTLRVAVQAGEPARVIAARWDRQTREFKARRKAFLIYR